MRRTVGVESSATQHSLSLTTITATKKLLKRIWKLYTILADIERKGRQWVDNEEQRVQQIIDFNRNIDDF